MYVANYTKPFLLTTLIYSVIYRLSKNCIINVSIAYAINGKAKVSCMILAFKGKNE